MKRGRFASFSRAAGGLLVAAVLLLSAGCRDAPKSAERPPEPVKVAPVVQRDVPIYGEWVGTTVGCVTAQIRARISGYLLSQSYKEGTPVKTGDLLFHIDPRPYQNALNQSTAQVKQAESQLEGAKAQVAQAEIARAQAGLDEAQLNFGWTKVLSPINGIAGIKNVDIGDLIAGSTILTTVSLVKPIDVQFRLSEQGRSPTSCSTRPSVEAGTCRTRRRRRRRRRPGKARHAPTRSAEARSTA